VWKNLQSVLRDNSLLLSEYTTSGLLCYDLITHMRQRNSHFEGVRVGMPWVSLLKICWNAWERCCHCWKTLNNAWERVVKNRQLAFAMSSRSLQTTPYANCTVVFIYSNKLVNILNIF